MLYFKLEKNEENLSNKLLNFAIKLALYNKGLRNKNKLPRDQATDPLSLRKTFLKAVPDFILNCASFPILNPVNI